MKRNTNALTVQEEERINRLLSQYSRKKNEKLIPFPRTAMPEKVSTELMQFAKGVRDGIVYGTFFFLGYTLLLELGVAVLLMAGIL